MTIYQVPTNPPPGTTIDDWGRFIDDVIHGIGGLIHNQPQPPSQNPVWIPAGTAGTAGSGNSTGLIVIALLLLFVMKG